MVKKVINIVLTLLMASFAVVQYNDPDPWLWITLYGLVAGICLLAVFEKYQPKFLLGGIILVIIGLGLYLPDFINWLQTGMASITESMKAESPHVELVREFLGILIILLVLVWQFFSSQKNRQ